MTWSTEPSRQRAATRTHAGGTFEIVPEMDAALDQADVVYPKSWGVYDLMKARQNAASQSEVEENQQACLARNQGAPGLDLR